MTEEKRGRKREKERQKKIGGEENVEQLDLFCGPLANAHKDTGGEREKQGWGEGEKKRERQKGEKKGKPTFKMLHILLLS